MQFYRWLGHPEVKFFSFFSMNRQQLQSFHNFRCKQYKLIFYFLYNFYFIQLQLIIVNLYFHFIFDTYHIYIFSSFISKKVKKNPNKNKNKQIMNTQQRLFMLTKFSHHIDKKLKKIQKQKINLNELIKNNQINIQSLPKVEIINQLSQSHQQIDKTITNTYQSISNIMNKLQSLKNKKQNTTKILDILTSINQVRKLSYSLKLQNCQDSLETYKILQTFYQIKGKTRFCENYIQQIEIEIQKIQGKYKKQFDHELTKTNSNNIKDIAKVLELIKNQKDKPNQNINNILNNNNNDGKEIQKSTEQSTSLIQISQFYVNMVKKQLLKFQEQLFNIPIVGNPNELSYIFFQIIKNAFKTIVSLIQTYKNNILKLQSSSGLHIIIVNIFKYVTQNLVLQILIRQKKYYQIDKISISRNKLTLKNSQYKILKNYFKEFNAIWNQIERFRMHLYDYLEEGYHKKQSFIKQLLDVINSTKFVEFNYEIILYFQAFLRYQLDKILQKNPFVLSLWKFDEDFFKQVRNKNQFKSNLAGQDFIEQMINKFTDGIKKSFQTLNILIISALINYINNHLIFEDSFYAFNELLNRFLSKITESISIQGIVLVMNTITTYPKAVKSSFQEIQIPEELPTQRIQNQIAQLVNNCKQKTRQFIMEVFEKILTQEFVQAKIRDGKYQEVTNLFKNLQKDLYESFIYKLSKHHVELILSREFKTPYTHMDVLDLEKQVRAIINFYEQKSHSIRQNFRKILIFIEVLLIENEGELKKLAQQLNCKYSQNELRAVWKLRST